MGCDGGIGTDIRGCGADAKSFIEKQLKLKQDFLLVFPPAMLYNKVDGGDCSEGYGASGEMMRGFGSGV